MLKGLAAGLLVVSGLAAGASAQHWGPLHGLVASTSSVMHTSLAELAQAAGLLGVPFPPLGGSSGGTTLGGVTVYEWDSTEIPDADDWDGYATFELNGDVFSAGIAFDVSVFEEFGIVEPFDASLFVHLIGLCWHELGHITYGASMAAWCVSNPATCAAYADCIAGLEDGEGNSLGYGADNDPCSESFAHDLTLAMLCQGKLVICTSGNPQAAVLLEELDLQIELVRAECEATASACSQCPGPPMPPSYTNCSPPTCNCA